MLKIIVVILTLISSISFSEQISVVETTKKITFGSSEMACGLLSHPGDIILQHENSFHEHRLGDNILLAAKIKELLSFNRPVVKYGHAEIITDIVKDVSNLSLVSWSFYPPKFQEHLPEEDRKGPFVQFGYGSVYPFYRMSFSVYRVKPSLMDSVTELREKALNNIQYRSKDSVYGYRKLPERNTQNKGPGKLVDTKIEFSTWLNVCSDFVAWAYEKHITSWWNRIPVARQLIAILYPPESFSTPDDLANSPYTEQVCEIENLELTYPKSLISVKKIVRAMTESIRSNNQQIKNHGYWVREVLLSNQVIDSDNKILIPQIELQVN